ncbi:hypothetical protein J2N86_13980 [Legionella lytica]|jgi:hypothetical protein|uniref:Coiled-coil protein n=1 Tax=Legionella lytica TaxID=96232 RepID=A0ABY4Y9C6_9GAMM|nr:hypothetical protein [Legionella lytica]USQ13762.1 hypothetical protein J2N86_13980 [Legionella lytica]
MGYSNAAFINDKNNFFRQLRESDTLQSDFGQVEALAKNHSYSDLLATQIDLEAEFTQLFAVLQKQNDEDSKEFWMYCYYCASVLESFYKAYSNKSKEKDYIDLKVQIRKRIMKEPEDAPSKTAFAQALLDNFTGSLNNLKKAPAHSSQLRDYVAYANVCRLYWTFTRLTLVNGLKFAKELQFIEQLDAILGTHTDVDNIISVFQAPNGILNYLSVGFFLARFMIDAGTLIRHTLFPTTVEEKNSSWGERFSYELYKRHWNFGNDLVWATVNFLTNFNHITNIPGPVAGGIIAVFLGFDVCMTLYRSYLFKQEYLVKKAQYSLERDSYLNPKSDDYRADLSSEQRLQHANILTKQLQELEIDWQTKEGKLYFVASAASLLMFGFSSTLIFSPPGIIIASYFACSVAIAMYLSTGCYGKYQEKSLRLADAELYNTGLELAQKEFDVARSDFIFTMAKNVIIPSVLITTFALYWPAAVILTAAYLGYELLHSHDQHVRNQEIQELAFGM